MRFNHIYRGLLLLYPADFRNQFSEEMICVFEQRAGERLASRNSATFVFVVTELSGILKGACTMWLAKILTVRRNSSSADTSNPPAAALTVAEAIKRRDAAIKKMVASIAAHDFINARRYSEEETRLKNLLQDSENGLPIGKSRTA